LSKKYPDPEPVKSSLQVEMKGVLSAFVAFSVAILILVIEGSIKADTSLAILALSLIAVAIPVGVVAYIISLKILNSARVPLVGYRKLEFCVNLSMSLTIVGFVFLLFQSNPVLGLVLAVATIGCFFLLINAVDSWNRSLLNRGSDVSDDINKE